MTDLKERSRTLRLRLPTPRAPKPAPRATLLSSTAPLYPHSPRPPLPATHHTPLILPRCTHNSSPSTPLAPLQFTPLSSPFPPPLPPYPPRSARDVHERQAEAVGAWARATNEGLRAANLPLTLRCEHCVWSLHFEKVSSGPALPFPPLFSTPLCCLRSFRCKH